jgi:hypothetical protein
MSKSSTEVPILLIWFNRPEHARRLLNQLREMRPSLVYVAIDGPRPGHPTDIDQVSKSVALLDGIDWPCKVERLIRSENMGCKFGVSSAIDWFFSKVEEGIILEDDCLPDPSFFAFCTDLLTRYRNVPSVMHIGGSNLINGKWWGDDSYLFTKVCHIWGWASWRRAWQHYDLKMTDYPDRKNLLLQQQITDRGSRIFWESVFDKAYTNRVDTWDYQWVYTIWKKNGLCILPAINLISNIGFDQYATHTKYVTEFAELSTGSLTVLKHPQTIEDNQVATEWIFRKLYRLPSTISLWLQKVKNRIILVIK